MCDPTGAASAASGGYIEPEAPWQNPSIESFSGHLTATIITTTRTVTEMVTAWGGATI
jgi:hypothetical protein